MRNRYQKNEQFAYYTECCKSQGNIELVYEIRRPKKIKLFLGTSSWDHI